MAETEEHKAIKARLEAAIKKFYVTLQNKSGTRYDYEIDRNTKLLNGAYRPDAILLDRQVVAEIWEVEVGGSWKALLGACVSADYAMSVESPGARANLWFVVPDTRTYKKLVGV